MILTLPLWWIALRTKVLDLTTPGVINQNQYPFVNLFSMSFSKLPRSREFKNYLERIIEKDHFWQSATWQNLGKKVKKGSFCRNKTTFIFPRFSQCFGQKWPNALNFFFLEKILIETKYITVLFQLNVETCPGWTKTWKFQSKKNHSAP